jgi:hypothetical protein
MRSVFLDRSNAWGWRHMLRPCRTVVQECVSCRELVGSPFIAVTPRPLIAGEPLIPASSRKLPVLARCYPSIPVTVYPAYRDVATK